MNCFGTNELKFVSRSIDDSSSSDEGNNEISLESVVIPTDKDDLMKILEVDSKKLLEIQFLSFYLLLLVVKEQESFFKTREKAVCHVSL